MATKMTLLQIVQEILSTMSSDEVNSIGDSTEAMRVAREVRATYESIVTPLDIPEHHALVQLQSVSDLSRPNYLVLPENVKKLDWFRYNQGTLDAPRWCHVEWAEPDDFIEFCLNITLPSTVVTGYTGGVLPCGTTGGPRFWTTFDDKYIVTDAYDTVVDDTLQSAKTLAKVQLSPVFQLTDDYVPAIDSNLFPLLMSEAKAACFINIKQVSNSNEERRAQRQQNRVQQNLHRSKQPREWGPDYGR